MSRSVSMFKRPTFLLKLLELVLASLCISLVADIGYFSTVQKVSVIYGTYIGYLMINVVVIMGNVMATPLHQFVMLAITVSGAFMYVAAGALLCEIYFKATHEASGRFLGSGILGMINGCVYLLDTFFTFKEQTIVVD